MMDDLSTAGAPLLLGTVLVVVGLIAVVVGGRATRPGGVPTHRAWPSRSAVRSMVAALDEGELSRAWRVSGHSLRRARVVSDQVGLVRLREASLDEMGRRHLGGRSTRLDDRAPGSSLTTCGSPDDQPA